MFNVLSRRLLLVDWDVDHACGELGQHQTELGLYTGEDRQGHLEASDMIWIVGLCKLRGTSWYFGFTSRWSAEIKE
jgi:hypothetical protein